MGSVYTISLFDLLEILNQERNTASNLQAHINNALPKIFDFDFPIWEESYRATLERKIIMHYLRKEICCETPEMWKIFLNERLNLIMPYYNQLYKTTVLEYDILNDVDWTEVFSESTNSKDDYTHKRNASDDITISRTGNETVNSTAKDNVTETETRKETDNTDGTINNDQTTKLLGSDLPQANYNGVDYGTTLQEGTNSSDSKETLNVTKDANGNKTNVADRSSNDKKDSSTTGSDNRTSSDNITDNRLVDGSRDNTRSRKGLTGNKSRSELIQEFRNAIVNIDLLIINELRDLFMLIY